MTSPAHIGSRLLVGVAAPVARRSGNLRRLTSARQFHFDSEAYVKAIRESMPRYDELQSAVADAAAIPDVRIVLDLGIGTGETAAAVIERSPGALIVGIDESKDMLAVARERLGSAQVAQLLVRRIEDELPSGPFDVVVSALAIHHLSARKKRDLFRRAHAALRPGGRFVMADIVRPEASGDAVTPISRVYDRPESPRDLERWLGDAGFDASVAWRWKDLAVFVGDTRRA